MAAVADLFAVTIDCPDPLELARFYQAFTGWELSWSNDDFVVLSGDGGVRLDFQRVPNPRPSDWPDSASPRRVHLDFSVADLAQVEAQVDSDSGCCSIRPDTHSAWRHEPPRSRRAGDRDHRETGRLTQCGQRRPGPVRVRGRPPVSPIPSVSG